MARKNSDGAPRGRLRGPATPRHSPVRGHAASPTTGHYAGCKWTEPPLPSALPPPPQHWMQAPHTHSLPFMGQLKTEQHDIDNQLKVLLKMMGHHFGGNKNDVKCLISILVDKNELYKECSSHDDWKN